MRQLRIWKFFRSVSLVGIISLMGFAPMDMAAAAVSPIPNPKEAKVSWKAQKVRDLNLNSSQLKFLAAASGLVVLGDTFYVVADDEVSLGIFQLNHPHEPGKLKPLLTRELSESNLVLRKAQKPDFESLALLSRQKALPHGGLLAVPSGSTPTRDLAVLVPFLDQEQKALGQPLEIKLTEIYTELRRKFPELNLEGAFEKDQKLWFFQRGNGLKGQNGFAQVDLAKLLKNPKQVPAEALLSVREISLGKYQGVNLGLSDAVPLKNGHILFSASAEAGASTFHDGEIEGTVLGSLTSEGVVKILGHVEPTMKVEGLALGPKVEGALGSQTVWLVPDADDRSKTSSLWKVMLPDL